MGRKRKLKLLHARKYRLSQLERKPTISESTEPKEDKKDEKVENDEIDEEEDDNESEVMSVSEMGERDTISEFGDEEEDNNLSKDELEKKLDRISHQYDDTCDKIWNNSLKMRALNL